MSSAHTLQRARGLSEAAESNPRPRGNLSKNPDAHTKTAIFRPDHAYRVDRHAKKLRETLLQIVRFLSRQTTPWSYTVRVNIRDGATRPL